MSMRKYVLTGRGSVTRWEHPDGRPCQGAVPPDAILVRHDRNENAELILEDASAQHPTNAHFKFVPLIAGSVSAEAKVPAPAGEVTTDKPAEHAKAQAKARARQPAEAATTSNIG